MIPNILHRIWLGPAEMPQLYVDYWAEWRRLHPAWVLTTWDEPALLGLTDQAPYGDRIASIWDALKITAKSCGVPMSQERATAVQRADIGGYLIAYAVGGIYVNCDMLPLRNIEPLLGGGHRLVLGREDDVHVVNAFIAAEPRHPYLHAILSNLPDSYNHQQHIGMEFATGPRLMTWLLDMDPGRFGAEVLKPQVLFPLHHSEIPYGTTLTKAQIEQAYASGAYTVHGWGHRWQEGRTW